MATTTSATREIAASPEAVFDVIAHIENFAEAIPHIVDVQFLTEQRRGIGTRFAETRLMRGREATTELEVTDYVPPSRVRLVSEAGGATWDTAFSVVANGDGTLLTMVMEATPHALPARIAVPLFRRFVAKAVEADLDAVKAHCEAG